MPERSFGRTVRYRRTKLGLSQAKLGELVGRSTATIRSWERDKSRPNDPKVLSALAAILGIDERHLFEKAEVEQPVVEETSTVEEALATLDPALREPVGSDTGANEYTELERSAQHEEPAEPNVRHLVGVASGPAFVAPPDPYIQGPLTPNIADLSYMEDRSQRQMYRVRTLATIVALVALIVAFLWAFEEGWGALGEWWDGFFSNLRL